MRTIKVTLSSDITTPLLPSGRHLDRPSDGHALELKRSGFFSRYKTPRTLVRADMDPAFSPGKGSGFRAQQHEAYKPRGLYWARDKDQMYSLILGRHPILKMRGPELKTRLLEDTQHFTQTTDQFHFTYCRVLNPERAVLVERDRLKSFMLENRRLPGMTGAKLTEALTAHGAEWLVIRGGAGNPKMLEFIQLVKGATVIRGTKEVCGG